MADIEAIRAAATERAAGAVRLGDIICTRDANGEYWSRVTAILTGQIVATKQKVVRLISKDIDGEGGGCKTDAFPDDLVRCVPAKLARKLAPEVAA